MTLDLFAGVAVSDLPRAVRWFDRFLGEVESFEPNDTERVWTVAENCHLYVELQPEHAGHSMVTLFVDDFDGFLEAAAGRGLDPQSRETYETGSARPSTATRTATKSASEARQPMRPARVDPEAIPASGHGGGSAAPVTAARMAA